MCVYKMLKEHGQRERFGNEKARGQKSFISETRKKFKVNS